MVVVGFQGNNPSKLLIGRYQVGPMEHGHTHTHTHLEIESDVGEARLAIVLFITAGYMIVEVVGGFLFNSLALLADAGHMLSDVVALGLSWIAIRIGKRAPTDRHTYGFKRTEILAAFVNGLGLWFIVGVIFYEAAQRFFDPAPVAGFGMLVVACAGLAVNLLMAVTLFGSQGENLNLRGAFLHVLSDALGSVGAIVAAVAILLTDMYWPDPLFSILIGLLILYSSFGLVKESAHILLEGVPPNVEIQEIEDAIVNHSGVCCVYDLHVWSISSHRVALSAHVVVQDPVVDNAALLRSLEKMLVENFKITHSTIQIETTHEMRLELERLVCRIGTSCDLTR